MALGNYADLIAEVPLWTGRSDLTSRIPQGIVLAEAKMNRKLRTLDMEAKNTAFQIGSEYVLLPADFGSVKSFYIQSSTRVVLDYASDDQITRLYPASTGTPRKYNIQGPNFRFGPVPDQTYTATLTYTVKVPALTATANNNWMMTKHPDAYLYGVLAEMAIFAQNPDAAKAYGDLMYSVMDEIKSSSQRDSSGSNMATTTA